MDKLCERCGKRYIAVRYKQKYCSNICSAFQKGYQPWNLGKTGYLTEEAKSKLAENIKKHILNETEDQRKQRMEKVHKTLKERGTYARHRLGKTGELDPGWKGENANYNSKHKWIQKHWKKTGTCEECGEKKLPNPLKRLKVGTYWHNPTKTYRRERCEWMEVCAKCHYKLDKISK